MAVSPIATAIDGGGRPVYYSIAADGSVMVNQSVPSNNPNLPPQPTAAQTLSGLKANSIAAFTDAIGETAVAATTASSSYAYVDRYATTGNPMTPFAWTGWQQLGNFVATSVTAASNGTSGAAVFAIGADSHVYENAYAPTSGSTASQWSGFQQVGASSASTISVVANKAGSYEVAALTGPASYVEATEAVDANGTISSAPFAQLGNFVASSINLTPGLNTNSNGNSIGDRLFLFAVGGDGVLYDDPLTLDASTGHRISTTYSPLGNPSAIQGAVTASAAAVSGNTITVTALVGATGALYQGQYQIPVSSTSQALSGFWGLINPGSPSAGTKAPLDFQATALVAVPSPPTGTAEFVSDDAGGNARVGAIASATTTFSGWVGLPTPGARQVVAGLIYGSPVVVELGSDGTVYTDITLGVFADGAPVPNPAGQPNPAGSFGTGNAIQFGGFTPLLGLKATSIGVMTDPDGDLVVLALTGKQSYVYADVIYNTNENNRRGETGWFQVGTIVASSIQGASANSGAGATVFALGVNNVVYTSSINPNGGSLRFGNSTDFAPLPGLSVASFSVHAVGSQILVAALSGPQNYGYANLYTPPTATTPSKTTGWTLAGKAVLQSVVATESPTGAPAVAGVDAGNGSFASISLSTNLANAPASNPDNELYYGNYGGNILVPLVYPNSAGVVYVSQSPGNAVILQGVLPGATSATSLNYFALGTLQPPVLVGSVVALSDGTSPYIIASGEDGMVYVIQGYPTGNPSNPYLFTTFASLGGPLLA